MAKTKALPTVHGVRDILNITQNIARVIEISLFGGLQVCFLVEKKTEYVDLGNYINQIQNTQYVSNYYKREFDPLIIENALEAHINVQMNPIFTADDLIGINRDSKEAVFERIEKANNFWIDKKPPKIKLDGANLGLFKTAVSRLCLNLQEIEQIIQMSETIAALGMHETVRPEHLAEAIQYKSSKIDLMEGNLIPYSEQLIKDFIF